MGIDQVFVDFYTLQGGQAVLGNGISPVFVINNISYQYTTNVLMFFDAAAAPDSKFGFAPIGTDLIKPDSALPISSNQPGIRYLNGHLIFSDFVQAFDTLGGLRFVGNPLTELRQNQSHGRYEQYFEKMGFYIEPANQDSSVQLIPYGELHCNLKYPNICQKGNDREFLMDNPAQPFIKAVERIRFDLTGKALTSPYLAPDGLLEQVYENVVIAISPDNISTATFALRPLPSMVGIAREQPVPPRQEPNLIFYPLENGLGFNVPKQFLDFIVQHGGYELSGAPATELFEKNGLYRQCYEHYCLDYDPNAAENARIHPAPLGYEYQESRSYQAPKFDLSIWEQAAIIAPGQAQVIVVTVYSGTINNPLKDYQPTLKIIKPDNSTIEMVFPPTAENGQSLLQVQMPDSQAGSTYSYTVCVSTVGSEIACKSDSWMVR
jgi:hypothetical protein